ncbi:hypothetical protein EUTSA_v10029119mg [Eutrema salsugineum]|uniref:Uncharacterized protein n=1 Tax=Eutrema salsugineum TaxID=72664 RepID=V4L7W9_EUTSA|nr:hypothetical protein EUTSA_v10029119mg [Eutrema salsugineum]
MMNVCDIVRPCICSFLYPSLLEGVILVLIANPNYYLSGFPYSFLSSNKIYETQIFVINSTESALKI